MYAMELNGSHVGRKAKFTWTTPSGEARNLKRKIRIVHHHHGGRVSVRPPDRYYYSFYRVTYRVSWEYIPFNAEVEFIE